MPKYTQFLHFYKVAFFDIQIRFDFSLPSLPPPLESAQNIYSYTCYSKNRDKRFYEDFFSKEAQDSFVFFFILSAGSNLE